MKKVFLMFIGLVGSSTAFGAINYDILIQRLYVVSKQKEHKKDFELKSNNFTETRNCAFNNGGLFYHTVCDKDAKNGDARIYNGSNYALIRIYGWRTNSYFPVHVESFGDWENGSLLELNHYQNRWGIFWSLLRDWTHTYFDVLSNTLKSCRVSSGGDRLICVASDKTYYQKRHGSWDRFSWDRTGGKRTIWIGENHVASTPDSGSKMSLYSIDKEPKIIEFEQGEDFQVQETCVSADSKIMGIASTYDKNDKQLTKIKLYDVQSQKEKGIGFVPGLICDERVGNMFFDKDAKNLVIHTKVKDGLNSYTFDVRSDEFNVVESFKHPIKTKNLGLLVGGYFGRLEENRVAICDMNNARDPLYTPYFTPQPTHFALHPLDPKKRAVIALATGDLYRFNNEKIITL